MATQAQRDQFISTYAPYAKQAGSQLGVDGNVILGQWANETGWGTNRGATQLNNLGGVNVAGGHGEDYQSYASPQDFTNSYVSMIQRKYPQATNTGSDANAYVAGLKQGGYFTSDLTTYQNNVSSTASSIAGNSNYQTSTASSQPTISYKGYNADGMFLGETADPTTLPITGATRYEALTAGGSPSSGTGTGTGSGTGTGTGSTGTSKAASSTPTPAANAPTAQALKDMLTNWVKTNPLNDYWQATYHFRLFMAGDAELLAQAGSGTITQLLKKVNGNDLTQVIVAETGVTGYNIKDVEIQTVDSMNAQTREQKGTAITMTITEPLGISFLDAIAGAGAVLGIFDYTKSIYYLQLSFTGYKEDGSFASNPIPFPGYKNGGQWLWALRLTTIETKVNEGGGVYTCRFVAVETELVISENKELKTKQMVAPQGTTLGELFTDYANRLNAAWADEYGKSNTGQPLVKFTIKTHPVPFVSDQYAGKDPATFTLTPQKPDKNPIRSLDLTLVNGKYVATVPAGMSINDFLSAAIMSTEEGQKLYKDEPTIGQPDISANQTNAQRFRVSKLFAIEPDIKPVAHDDQTGNYFKEITLNVTPTYWNGSLLSRPQVNDAKIPAVQRQMIESLGKNGFLRKQYEYIFTGLNTEVLDFDITFNLTYQPLLPKAAGFRMNALNIENHRRTADPPPPVTSEQLNFRQFKSAGGGLPQQPNATLAQKKSSYEKMAADAIMTGIDSSGKPNAAVPNSSGGNNKIYMEDVLSRLNQGDIVNLPISFDHGYLSEHWEAAPGVNGQYHPDRPLAATVLTQRLTVDFYQKIEMTIRGDPYWLGQSNIERQIALRAGNIHDPDDLPNNVTGPANILLYFRFPLQLGDEFKPILKDSAAFNGIYQITMVKHTFSEGAFKQVLTGVRSPLVDIAQALTTDSNAKTNDQASSPLLRENNSSDVALPNNPFVPGVLTA